MRISNPTAKKGEDLAVNYLRKHGYTIIERNFRKGYGEIDIIATKNNTLVFIEVKTRTTGLYGGAIESIAQFKIRKLMQTAEYYKMLHSSLPDSLRIDAILIDIDDKGKANIEHVENITS